MRINIAEPKPVMVITTYDDGSVKIVSAENIADVESVVRDTDMAADME